MRCGRGRALLESSISFDVSMYLFSPHVITALPSSLILDCPAGRSSVRRRAGCGALGGEFSADGCAVACYARSSLRTSKLATHVEACYRFSMQTHGAA